MRQALICAVAAALLGVTAAAVVPGTSVAGEATVVYDGISVTISAPDSAEPGTDFSVEVAGSITGSGFGISAFSLYEDAAWYYNEKHLVRVESGSLIDEEGFLWSSSYADTYVLNATAGTYRYTFVFGDRSFGHTWYDVAVEIDVVVADAGPALCGAWRPLLAGTGRAGRTIPLKFTARTCDTDEFYRDEAVLVEVRSSGGDFIESMVFTGNPHTGVDVNGGAELYHANWDTGRSPAGDTYSVSVFFSAGDTLTRSISLR